MKFYIPNVMDEKLKILDLKLNSVLEFDWFGDVIRFVLYPENDGCRLILLEKVKTITEQTKKDLAGWHVCLDVIIALLDGETFYKGMTHGNIGMKNTLPFYGGCSLFWFV